MTLKQTQFKDYIFMALILILGGYVGIQSYLYNQDKKRLQQQLVESREALARQWAGELERSQQTLLDQIKSGDSLLIFQFNQYNPGTSKTLNNRYNQWLQQYQSLSK